MAKILIVDDRSVERKFLSTLLKSASHTVVEASDGVEALSVATSTVPDLVISDILMPTIDGYELVRQMREISALSRTPVIFYTATYHEREALALALQCGVAAILTKPSAPKLILERVATVLAAGGTPVAPAPDRARFSEEHVRVVSPDPSKNWGCPDSC